MSASNFLEDIEKFGRGLMKECNRSGIDIRDKIAIFSSLVKFAAVKGKLEPEGGDEGDGWEEFRKRAGGKNSQPAPAQENRAAGHYPVTDTDASRAASEKERSLRTSDSGDDNDPFQNTSPPVGSFPIHDGSVHSGNNGSKPAGNHAPDSGGNL